MGDRTKGIYRKFEVRRTDGRSESGQKHHHCNYFILDLHHDKHARASLLAYANSCASEYPQLAQDIRDNIRNGTWPLGLVAPEKKE